MRVDRRFEAAPGGERDRGRREGTAGRFRAARRFAPGKIAERMLAERVEPAPELEDAGVEPAAARQTEAEPRPARQYRGWSIRSLLMVTVGAVLLPMLSALGILAQRVGVMRDATLAVKEAYETIQLGHFLVAQFHEIQLSVHAYALTGNREFLTIYQNGRRDWSQTDIAVSAAIRKEPALSERFLKIEQDVEDFFTEWEDRLASMQPGSQSQADMARIDEDKEQVARIAASIAGFVREEEEKVRERLAEEDAAQAQVYYSAIGTSVLAVLLLVLFASMLGRSIAWPIHRVAEASVRLGEGFLEERVEPSGAREPRILATAFNQMAAALQQARAALDARNQELELFAGRLKNANEDLLERQRESEDFLYVVSHDLRAPLINIQGFTKRLQTSMATVDSSLSTVEVPEDARKHLSRMGESLKFIQSGTAKIDQLIARLLEISRLTTRAKERQWVDMNVVAREVVQALQFQMEERGIEPVIGKLPKVLGDPVQLNQVLSNLVDNAVKYMGDRPTKRISITATPERERYRFAVKDTGPGISETDKEKVFRMFARLDPTKTQGEGIGLTAVRTIVNRHGGRIWVESELGEGSTFYFTLPKHAESASERT